MVDELGWVPDEVDVDELLAIQPNICDIAHRNRAVLVLVEAGVRQFLDLGSGIPTVGNVHEIAQKVASESRVVYAHY